jgi:hypothetical protein
VKPPLHTALSFARDALHVVEGMACGLLLYLALLWMVAP